MVQLIVILFLSNFILAVSFIIQPKGPTHRNVAVKCLMEITKDAINFTKAKYNTRFLLTYVVTKNLNSPAYEIQQEVLKHVHNQEYWSIEVLENDRKEFQAHGENCNNFPRSNVNFQYEAACSRKPVKTYKTKFYIMVVETLENFNKKFKFLTNSSSFSAEAMFLIYVSKSSHNLNISKQVALKLWNYTAVNSVVITPKNLTIFNIYQIKINNEARRGCYTQFNIEISHQCIAGTITKHENNLFKKHVVNIFRNCVIKVHAIAYEPFVISRNSGIVSGIEIDIMHEIGRKLNISFDIKISSDGSLRLGYQNQNGTWMGFVAPIYNLWDWGIGNISPENEFLRDFTYSIGYYSEKLVWVVPIAPLIPRWRVLMVIFTLEMWGICLATIFGFAILLYISKTKNEVVSLRTLEKCFAAAFELVLAVPVPHQPVTHFTRVIFIGLAIFGIIINSIYTCSLVYYLQNPIRAHQISTGVEIAMSDLWIGGPPKYMEMFKASPSPYARMIIDRYLTVNESLDTYKYWLNLVGNNRNMATISVKLCANYLLSKKPSIIADQFGNTKVYVFPEPLMSQSIGIMMRRGAFAKDAINLLIQRLIIEAGIIEKIKSNYVRGGIADDENDGQDSSVDDNVEDKGISALSIHHLQGAFVILALGHGFGVLTFVLELFYHKTKKRMKND